MKYLVDIMDENCVMLGSDCPFPLGEENPGELILKTYPDDKNKCAKLLNQNAREFFKIN